MSGLERVIVHVIRRIDIDISTDGLTSEHRKNIISVKFLPATRAVWYKL